MSTENSSTTARTRASSLRDINLGKHGRIKFARSTHRQSNDSRLFEASVSFGPDRSRHWPDWVPKRFHGKDVGITTGQWKIPSSKFWSQKPAGELGTPTGSRGTAVSEDQTEKEEAATTKD